MLTRQDFYHIPQCCYLTFSNVYLTNCQDNMCGFWEQHSMQFMHFGGTFSSLFLISKLEGFFVLGKYKRVFSLLISLINYSQKFGTLMTFQASLYQPSIRVKEGKRLPLGHESGFNISEFQPIQGQHVFLFFLL